MIWLHNIITTEHYMPTSRKFLNIFLPQGCRKVCNCLLKEYMYMFVNTSARASGPGNDLTGRYRREEQNIMTFMLEHHVIPLLTAHDWKSYSEQQCMSCLITAYTRLSSVSALDAFKNYTALCQFKFHHHILGPQCHHKTNSSTGSVEQLLI